MQFLNCRAFPGPEASPTSCVNTPAGYVKVEGAVLLVLMLSAATIGLVMIVALSTSLFLYTKAQSCSATAELVSTSEAPEVLARFPVKAPVVMLVLVEEST